MDVFKRSRNFLIKSILERELAMFLKVNGEQNAPCQDQPEAFKKIRGSIYEMWSDQMLEAWFKDLIVAERTNRNLVFEKYARMENKIPILNKSPLIKKIVDIEEKWQEELKEKYPFVYRYTCRDMTLAGDGSDFKVYLSCELETYSDNTLDSYYTHVREAFDKGENLSVEMLRKLARKSGIDNLDILEKRIQADSEK